MADRLRLVHAATFFASFDRLLIAPLLIPMAQDLGVPVQQVAMLATVYYLSYGLMQLVWGFVSDRLGRVRTMRLALSVAAVAGLTTALAPGPAVLVVARLVAGGAFAATIPGAIIYIGDTVPAARRHAPLTDLMTATALGMASASLVGAALADLLGWRVAFALPALGVAVLTFALRSVPEPHRQPRSVTGASGLGAVLGRPWPVLVLGLVLVEGMVLLGILTYLPAMLQAGGMSTTGSGVVTAGYGLAVVAAAAAVKRLSRRLSPARLIALGGTSGTAAYVALVVDQGWPGVLVASILLACAWAFMHSTMQAWVTEVAPQARATAVSLFASCLFLGSAAWTAVGAPAIASGRPDGYLLAGAVVTAGLTVAASAARHRFPGG